MRAHQFLSIGNLKHGGKDPLLTQTNRELHDDKPDLVAS